MLRLAFDFIIAWRETRTRPNAYPTDIIKDKKNIHHIQSFPPIRISSLSKNTKLRKLY